MKNKIAYIKKEQKRISEIVTGKFENYYLTGGTALALYFNHRFSEDLDFFTQKYKREEPDRIMKYIAEKTGFEYKLEREQADPKLIPMKVYFLELKKGCVLKIDFVRDFQENIKRIKSGRHSVEDIYYRKIIAAMGLREKEDVTGRVIATGRQTTKDLFDIFYLSRHYKPVSDFFLEAFSIDKAEGIIAWYKGFNRLDLKLELLDLGSRIDSGEILRHLDEELLRNLPDKLI